MSPVNPEAGSMQEHTAAVPATTADLTSTGTGN